MLLRFLDKNYCPWPFDKQSSVRACSERVRFSKQWVDMQYIDYFQVYGGDGGVYDVRRSFHVNSLPSPPSSPLPFPSISDIPNLYATRNQTYEKKIFFQSFKIACIITNIGVMHASIPNTKGMDNRYPGPHHPSPLLCEYIS